MELTVDILREFKQVTSKDIEMFFRKSVSFFSIEYNAIVSYYSGRTTSITSKPFEVFEKLKKECKELFETYHLHSKRFNNVKWWLVLEELENIDSRLSTLSNINRWSRSSLTKVGYDPDVSVQYTLKQNQTLERISQDILQSNNPDGWVDIALNNDLSEEEYSPEGGVNLTLKYPKINRGLQVNSVVDVMIGKSIYGKDLYKKLSFENDDLKVLGYDDTVRQSVETLALLKKNDNPDYPSEGLQTAIIVGGNRVALNFPVIIRQMTETFSTDDSLKNFSVTNLEVKEDNVRIDYEVQTRLNETFDGQAII